MNQTLINTDLHGYIFCILCSVFLISLGGCGTAPQKEKVAVKIGLAEVSPAAPSFITSRRVYDTGDRRTCRQYLAANPPDYSGHPLYGEIDISLLKRTIEETTGKPWIITFARYWLDCHPLGDPIAKLDVDWDGITGMNDFNILSAD